MLRLATAQLAFLGLLIVILGSRPQPPAANVRLAVGNAPPTWCAEVDVARDSVVVPAGLAVKAQRQAGVAVVDTWFATQQPTGWCLLALDPRRGLSMGMARKPLGDDSYEFALVGCSLWGPRCVARPFELRLEHGQLMGGRDERGARRMEVRPFESLVSRFDGRGSSHSAARGETKLSAVLRK